MDTKENMDTKEYKLNIDPKILELLGPNLYTNIYPELFMKQYLNQKLCHESLNLIYAA